MLFQHALHSHGTGYLPMPLAPPLQGPLKAGSTHTPAQDVRWSWNLSFMTEDALPMVHKPLLEGVFSIYLMFLCISSFPFLFFSLLFLRSLCIPSFLAFSHNLSLNFSHFRWFSLLNRIFSTHFGLTTQFRSMEPDEIHNHILKKSAQELDRPFYTCFKQSPSIGGLTELWNTTHIIPILKSGDRPLPNSYKPINFTRIPWNILEHIIETKTFDHLTRNNMIRTEQHVLLPGKSCFMDSLTQVPSNVQSSLNFAKSFDKVPHQLLICKH